MTSESLRARAERLLAVPQKSGQVPDENTQKLVHDSVHQIELEMQNDELRRPNWNWKRRATLCRSL